MVLSLLGLGRLQSILIGQVFDADHEFLSQGPEEVAHVYDIYNLYFCEN